MTMVWNMDGNMTICFVYRVQYSCCHYKQTKRLPHASCGCKQYTTRGLTELTHVSSKTILCRTRAAGAPGGAPLRCPAQRTHRLQINTRPRHPAGSRCPLVASHDGGAGGSKHDRMGTRGLIYFRPRPLCVRATVAEREAYGSSLRGTEKNAPRRVDPCCSNVPHALQ